VRGSGCRDSSAHLGCSLGSSNAWLTARLTVAMASGDVPLRAHRLYQPLPVALG
jgi:hypothetical protein